MFVVPLILAAILGLSNAGHPLYRDKIAAPKSDSLPYRLPNNLTVSLYQLVVEPDFDAQTFNGSVSVSFTTWTTTSSIVLHTHEINITTGSINLLDNNGNVINGVASTQYSNDDRQFYTITFFEPLLGGNSYTISIGDFIGILNWDMYGFYLARYVDAEGNTRKIATTQFQATAARRAFPCFDEPALKARFDISIVRTSEYHSLANTPQVSTQEISPGRFLDVFERSVIMSTYLVAFVVSDFAYVGRDIHRVFGRPQDIARNRGDYALDIGIDILDGIEEWVDIPYSLPKIDQIAIPDDYFDAGAMENWGLVTYREEYLMFETNVTNSDIEEFIAMIIAHEFGHQWFGNLVSPAWWNYLWLNEGFATYFEFFGGAMANDDLQLFDQMVVQSVQTALRRDSSAYTRYMNLDAGSPDDIDALFDVVAYDKAGAVIRMAEGFLTTPVFRSGCNIFLRNRAYDAAVPSDLYSAWQAALAGLSEVLLPGNATVETVLTTWDSNPGYPLITVTIQGNSIQFYQRRFIDSDPFNTDPTIWYVPISIATASNPSFANTLPRLWLTERTTTANLTDLGANDWVIVNIQQSGYYRVNYEQENWDRIISTLVNTNFSFIHRANRAQLVDDSYSLARYGVVDYSIPLRLTTYFTREDDFIAMHPFFQALSYLDPFMANSESYPSFRNYVLTILSYSYNSVGLVEHDSDSHATKRNRERITTWTCRYRDPNCLGYALERLRLWQQSESYLIVPNQQTVLTCAALRTGNQADWNFVLDRYAREEMVVRRRLLRALGCSENEAILNGFVNMILSNGSQILPQDRLSAFASIYNSGNYGLQFVTNYVKTNFNTTSSMLTSSQISSLFNGLASRYTTMDQFYELFNFAEAMGLGDTVLWNALTTVIANVYWSTQFIPTIDNWLQTNNY